MIRLFARSRAPVETRDVNERLDNAVADLDDLNRRLVSAAEHLNRAAIALDPTQEEQS